VSDVASPDDGEVARTVAGLVLATLRGDAAGFDELVRAFANDGGPVLWCALALLIEYGERVASLEGSTLEDDMRALIENYSRCQEIDT
jgi:hypothetical protein